LYVNTRRLKPEAPLTASMRVDRIQLQISQHSDPNTAVNLHIANALSVPSIQVTQSMSDTTLRNNTKQLAIAISGLWWLPLVRGIVLLILGCYALFRPGMTLATYTQVAGFFLVLDGVFAMMAGVVGQVPSRLWTTVRGIVAVLAGTFVFTHPVVVAGLATTVVVSVIGVMAIFSGAMEIIAAIKDRKQIEGEGWLILAGVLLVLIGMALLATPLLFGISMVRILGVLAIISSMAMIVFAVRMKGLRSALTDPETAPEDTL
jgi:uncharacterized membrane protein HdeD (DUF308 family)